ncbi:retinol dehydrogenase 7 [Exaiptasia diaphana]|uniref:Uncharacterized protein n=1 Tax=Exaiptasia diaphana TaxID=2652724 RepID=A0A913X767_EXADI|nr:retinol dehydrogenase 7 [Exaiptasia diaphana]KXJ26958.1 Retinol dehydrogenase 2 [Exaiptasia diaphana]
MTRKTLGDITAVENMLPMYLLLPTAFIALLVLRYLMRLLLPRPQVTDFYSKYVLITGCDSGFGKMTAIRLDRLGFRVIAACLTDQGKENIKKICSDRLVSINLDVTNSKQIHEVFAKVKHLVSEKGIWALVNNAGIITNGPIEWFKMEDFKRMADVNLWGLIEVTQTFLPLVKKAEGRVVNVGSVAGIMTVFSFGPYSVTKYGVEAFSDALRREMVEHNVKVSIIEPQAFRTPLVNGLCGKKLDELWDRLSDEKKSEFSSDCLEKAREGIKGIFDRGLNENPKMVVDAITDAVSSRDPQPRYLVGPFAKVFAFSCLLPTWLQDHLLSLA